MNPTQWSVEAWAAIGSAGTALAFMISAWVLWLQLRDRRRSVAEGLTVWIDDRYERASDGSIVRSVTAHVKNAGTGPAFDAQVVVGHGFIGSRTTRIGPLAVPTQPVLAPGAELTWPIEDLLRSVEMQGRLVAEVSFRDASNRWWIRDFDGRIRRWRSRLRRSTRVVKDVAGLETFGPVSMENPVSVAAAFWLTLGDPESKERTTALRALCTPESLPAWGNFADIRDLLEDHGLASFPSYPAPGVAYVKFPEDVDNAMVVTGPTLMAAQIMTLQYRTDMDPPGWRVFGIGSPVPPDKIPPPGTTP